MCFSVVHPLSDRALGRIHPTPDTMNITACNNAAGTVMSCSTRKHVPEGTQIVGRTKVGTDKYYKGRTGTNTSAHEFRYNNSPFLLKSFVSSPFQTKIAQLQPATTAPKPETRTAHRALPKCPTGPVARPPLA